MVNWLLSFVNIIRLLWANLIGFVVILALAGFAEGNYLLILIVISGFFCGIANALFTTLAMGVSPYSRSISSGAYNFTRWSGAALAPVVSGLIGEHFGMGMPFVFASVLLLVGSIAIWFSQSTLNNAMEVNGGSAHHSS